jgi:primosomal protein N' (replication factor Y)
MTAAELAQVAKVTQAPIAALRHKGLIVARTERLHQRRAEESAVPRVQRWVLNDDQQAALQAILEALHGRRQQTVLIHGVTGSGKTEVYIQAIEEVVRFGRQAIVLVPEISLTPQTLERFRARFEQVAVLHSHLSDAERHWQWQRIADGQVQVVVGARSAIFAPVPHLGLIVILDEEHESTFKQETSPRYHARDVALARCEMRSRCRWCWARPRPRWRVGSGPSRAGTGWSQCRGACSAARCRRWVPSTCETTSTRATRAARSAGTCTRRCTTRWPRAGK